MNKQSVLKAVDTSIWPTSDKVRLAKLLPEVRDNGYEFLFLSLSENDSLLVSSILVDAVEKVLKAIAKAMTGDINDLLVILNEASHSPEYNFGRWVLPFVLDYKKSSNRMPKSLQLALNKFELSLFKDLPLDELRDLVKTNLVYFLKRVNVVMEFKRICYSRNIEFSDKLAQQFLFFLESNEEELTANAIVLEDKQVKPTIKNWLRDFMVSVPQTMEGANTFNEVRYLEKSPNVLKLSKQDRQALLDVFKLYDWFLNPEVRRQEVERYEQYMEHVAEQQEGVTAPVYVSGDEFMPENKKAAPPASAPQAAGSGSKPKLPPVPVPPPRSVPAPALQQKAPSVDIDKKLQELRSKAKQ